MLTVELVNQSGLASVSDYAYRVKVNTRVIANGRITAHPRPLPWPHLVLRVVQDAARGAMEGR